MPSTDSEIDSGNMLSILSGCCLEMHVFIASCICLCSLCIMHVCARMQALAMLAPWGVCNHSLLYMSSLEFAFHPTAFNEDMLSTRYILKM